jgi:hypothetical protein
VTQKAAILALVSITVAARKTAKANNKAQYKPNMSLWKALKYMPSFSLKT